MLQHTVPHPPTKPVVKQATNHQKPQGAASRNFVEGTAMNGMARLRQDARRIARVTLRAQRQYLIATCLTRKVAEVPESA